MKLKQILLLALVGAVLLSGCGKTTSSKGNISNADLGKSSIPAGYPIQTEETLKYWTGNFTPHADYSNYKEQPFFYGLEERTGVKIEFMFAPAGQRTEAFNLLIASNNLPDIISYDWAVMPGGPEKYILDGYILKLNDILPVWAPNLTEYLSKNQEADRMVKTDEGTYYAFPFLRGDDYLTTYSGPVIRGDYLEKIDMSVPTTIDEWETMLKKFKNELNIAVPFTYTKNSEYGISSAFGAYKDFYVEDGKVKYGPYEKAWKDYLTLVSKWFKEGLIDPDITAIDGSIVNAKMSSGIAASAMGTGGNIGNWTSAGKVKNPQFKLIGVPIPTLEKGQTPKFGQKDNLFPGWGCAAITRDCKNVELAAKYLDYAYSEEGSLYYNFGIEGESYDMVNGYPKYSDKMKDYPGDLGMSISRYVLSLSPAPYVHDKRMYEQRMELPEQKEAINIWAKTDMKKYKLPPISPTADEVEETAYLMSEIETYVDETYYQFLFGDKNLSEFEQYQAKLEELGIARVLELKNNALNRYNKR